MAVLLTVFDKVAGILILHLFSIGFSQHRVAKPLELVLLWVTTPQPWGSGLLRPVMVSGPVCGETPVPSETTGCRKPVWGIPPMTRSWGRKLTYARRAQTSGAPLEIPKHVPQQKICWLLCSAFPLFWYSLEKSQFRALVFCIWKGCFS